MSDEELTGCIHAEDGFTCINDCCDYCEYYFGLPKQIDALKSHAVEVLAKALQNRYISMISLGCKTEKDLSMETMRAEARALLGWEE